MSTLKVLVVETEARELGQIICIIPNPILLDMVVEKEWVLYRAVTMLIFKVQ